MIREPDRTPGNTPVPKRSKNRAAEKYHQSLAGTEPTQFGACSHLLAYFMCNFADGRSSQKLGICCAVVGASGQHCVTYLPGYVMSRILLAGFGEGSDLEQTRGSSTPIGTGTLAGQMPARGSTEVRWPCK